MGLSETKKKALEDKKFDELFSDNANIWESMARKAYMYAKKNITNGNEPRPDDIAKILTPMIEVDEKFRAHQEDNRARAKRFVEMFTDYVIDKELVKQKGTSQ